MTQSDLAGSTLKDTLVSLTLSWEEGQKRLVKKLPRKLFSSLMSQDYYFLTIEPK